MQPIISCHNLTRILPGEVPVTLVRDVSLSIDEGAFVAITGPSGSGKSSLLYLLGLLDRPTSGELWINSQSMNALTEEALTSWRLTTIGFVFQYHFLLAEFSALENVMLPLLRTGRLSHSEAEQRSVELLEQFDLAGHAQKLPSQLSGGQRQRVAVARALANRPKLILADEPTGNLDSISSQNVQKILEDLARTKGHTVVVVTHDQAFAARTDKILHIVDGALTK